MRRVRARGRGAHRRGPGVGRGLSSTFTDEHDPRDPSDPGGAAEPGTLLVVSEAEARRAFLRAVRATTQDDELPLAA